MTHIVFALYPDVTHLDFTGPQQFLSRMPGAQVTMASVSGEPLESEGLTFANLTRLADIEACDVLCIPGGVGVCEAINEADFIREVRRLGAMAKYLTSVCTGSLALGAAGFLRGKRAACHWAWRDLLEPFGAVVDEGRVVRDGFVITGGGVTAGIDFALVLIAELAGPQIAQSIQLGLEYAPAPPVRRRPSGNRAGGGAGVRQGADGRHVRRPPRGRARGGGAAERGGVGPSGPGVGP